MIIFLTIFVEEGIAGAMLLDDVDVVVQTQEDPGFISRLIRVPKKNVPRKICDLRFLTKDIMFPSPLGKLVHLCCHYHRVLRYLWYPWYHICHWPEGIFVTQR